MELRGTYDREGNTGFANKIFLHDLAAEITHRLEAVGTDDREGNVVTNTRRSLFGEQIAAGRLKKCAIRLGLEGRRICNIDNDFCARENRCQAFAG